MFLHVLVILSYVSVCMTAYNVTIENDTGDPTNDQQLIYEPAGLWVATTMSPREGDTNPYNLSSSANVTITYTPSRTPILRWLTLLFRG